MKKIKSVAVVGSGYMGGGIAQTLAAAGVEVIIADLDEVTAVRAFERLTSEATRFESAGMVPAGWSAAVAQNLRPVATVDEAVASVGFIEEAVPERVDVKHKVLAQISAAALPGAIIASNTSTIPVSVLVTAVTQPERFLTVHWSNPAPFIPGVEIVVGESTSEDVVHASRELLSRAGRQSAVVADVPGFVLNRLQYVLLKEASLIVEEGVATVEDVDMLVRTTFGFRLPFFGPFAIADMAGLDVYADCFGTFEDAFGERFAEPRLLRETVESGALGFKSGRGFRGEFDEEARDRIVAYRSSAYAGMADMLQKLGPSPFESEPTKTLSNENTMQGPTS